jgi:hypothetical protein
MRNLLAEYPAWFEPDEVQILLAAFDKAWEAVQASSIRCGRYSRNELLRPQWTVSATWAGCATALYSPCANNKLACVGSALPTSNKGKHPPVVYEWNRNTPVIHPKGRAAKLPGGL